MFTVGVISNKFLLLLLDYRTTKLQTPKPVLDIYDVYE